MDTHRKILVTEQEAMAMLSIAAIDLEWLVNTGQLTPIKIRGHQLFEVSKLEELVAAYKIVQGRGTHNESNQRP